MNNIGVIPHDDSSQIHTSFWENVTWTSPATTRFRFGTKYSIHSLLPCYLRASSKSAKWPSSLQNVGIAGESAILDTCQRTTAYRWPLSVRVSLSRDRRYIWSWDRPKKDLQLLTFAGTQRPVWPLTLQTSCFKLVAATQHAPVGTGRFALAPAWRSSMTMPLATARKAKRVAEIVNFILASEGYCRKLSLGEDVIVNYFD